MNNDKVDKNEEPFDIEAMLDSLTIDDVVLSNVMINMFKWFSEE